MSTSILALIILHVSLVNIFPERKDEKVFESYSICVFCTPHGDWQCRPFELMLSNCGAGEDS